MKKPYIFATMTGVTALVASAVFVPSVAYATSSTSWSQSSICPGQTVTLTINGVADGSTVTMPGSEILLWTTSGGGLSQQTSSRSGVYSYTDVEINHPGETVSIQPWTDWWPVPGVAIGSAATLNVLATCPPAPSSDATDLPNTGVDVAAVAATAGVGMLAAASGLVLVRRRRAQR